MLGISFIVPVIALIVKEDPTKNSSNLLSTMKLNVRSYFHHTQTPIYKIIELHEFCFKQLLDLDFYFVKAFMMKCY